MEAYLNVCPLPSVSRMRANVRGRDRIGGASTAAIAEIWGLRSVF